MGTDIEQRLRRAEDILEIHQLFIDYGMHLDAGRFEEYGALFAREGELVVGPMGTAKGPTEISALMATQLEGKVGLTFHMIGSPMVQIDGDHATSEVMWSMIQPGPDGKPELAMLGRHRDQLVREDGRWRFQRRKGYIDIPNVYPTEK